MTNQGKGLKSKAHATIFAALAHPDYDFPRDLILKKGRRRSKATEYTASVIIDGETLRIARIHYSERQGKVLHIEDLRTDEVIMAIEESNFTPLERARKELAPKVVESLKYHLGADFLAWQQPSADLSIFSAGKIVVKDQHGLRRVVHCLPACSSAEQKVLLRRVEQDNKLRDSSCVPVWKENSRPEHVAEQISQQVRGLRKKYWRNPR